MLEDMKHAGEIIPVKDDQDLLSIEENIDLAQHHTDPLSQPSKKLNSPLLCFCCYQSYIELHHFYHKFCPKCAALNWEKRSQGGNLHGKHALITGGRIKIGYQCVLYCLRNGCDLVHVTTRFPKDCAKRFAAEKDFHSFKDRLRIYGLGKIIIYIYIYI